MPRRRRQRLEPPTHSVDATDWRMYCDLLQDAEAPEEQWQRVRRIADSLALDVRLVLMNPCPAGSLSDHRYGNHWLRVGREWFIGAPGTYIEDKPRLVWWRPAWVRDGFARYPSTDPDRKEEELLALNHGTPWNLPHPRYGLLRDNHDLFTRAILAFFEGHSQHEMPAEYA